MQGARVTHVAQSQMPVTGVAPVGAGRGRAPGWGVVFLERAGWRRNTSHALRPRCLSKHSIPGRWQRQTSSLLLPEHVWVCLLLEKAHERAAAAGSWFLAGSIVQIRLCVVKKGKVDMSRRVVFLAWEAPFSKPLSLRICLALTYGLNPGSQSCN